MSTRFQVTFATRNLSTKLAIPGSNCYPANRTGDSRSHLLPGTRRQNWRFRITFVTRHFTTQLGRIDSFQICKICRLIPYPPPTALVPPFLFTSYWPTPPPIFVEFFQLAGPHGELFLLGGDSLISKRRLGYQNNRAEEEIF